DTAARTQVEHDVALVQLGQGRRIPAAERRDQRLRRQARDLSVIVQIRTDGIARLSRGPAAARRARRLAAGHTALSSSHLSRDAAIALSHDVAKPVGFHGSLATVLGHSLLLLIKKY